MIEAKIADTTNYFAVFDQERSIAGHAGKDFLVRINFADVPEPRDQNSALGGSDHLLDRLWISWSFKDDVHRRFAHFVGNGEAVSGGSNRTNFSSVFRVLHLLGACSCIHQPLHNSVFDQLDLLAAHAFAIERRPRLQWMRHVVPDRNVLAEQPRADSIAEKRPLIENREPAEVEECETNGVEHSGRLQNYGVLAGRDLLRCRRLSCLPGCNVG